MSANQGDANAGVANPALTKSGRRSLGLLTDAHNWEWKQTKFWWAPVSAFVVAAAAAVAVVKVFVPDHGPDIRQHESQAFQARLHAQDLAAQRKYQSEQLKIERILTERAAENWAGRVLGRQSASSTDSATATAPTAAVVGRTTAVVHRPQLHRPNTAAKRVLLPQITMVDPSQQNTVTPLPARSKEALGQIPSEPN